MKKFNENRESDLDENNDLSSFSNVSKKRKTEEELNRYEEDKEISKEIEEIHETEGKEFHNHEEETFKKLDDKEEKDQYINLSMKKFRTIIGAACLVFMVLSFISMGGSKKALKDNLSSGIIENVSAGEILSNDSVKLEAKDETVKILDGYGNLEISVWNFVQKEDYDYVQVFIDGSPVSEPFAIRHRPVKISVPDKAVITVQGVRDGSNNGITYGVSFNKTGETYLNMVNSNGTNTYTIVSD